MGLTASIHLLYVQDFDPAFITANQSSVEASNVKYALHALLFLDKRVRSILLLFNYKKRHLLVITNGDRWCAYKVFWLDQKSPSRPKSDYKPGQTGC